MLFRSKRKTIRVEKFANLELDSHDIHILSKFQNIFFPSEFNGFVPKLPSGILKIVFGNNFNYIINQTNLPDSLEYLRFGGLFNQIVDDLPLSLTSLQFGSDFNQSVQNLPPNLKILRFGTDFNQNIDNLPCGLKIIFFGQKFNNSVDSLPESLIWIKFSYEFNQSVNNLPVNLLYVEFGCKFNQSICSLPNSIKKLIFSNSSEYNIIHEKLPSRLEYLKLPRNYLKYNRDIDEYLLPEQIPTTLKKIISCNYYYHDENQKYWEKMKQLFPDLDISIEQNWTGKIVTRYKHIGIN